MESLFYQSEALFDMQERLLKSACGCHVSLVGLVRFAIIRVGGG